MNIKELVLSIKQIQHLKELGVKVEDTALSWVKLHRDICGKFKENAEWKVEVNPFFFGIMQSPEIVQTLTLQEILGMLPYQIDYYGIDYTLHSVKGRIGYALRYLSNGGNKLYYSVACSYLECAYMMLCWCAENKYLDSKYYEVGTTKERQD